MLQSTTNTVLWDEKQSFMEIETIRSPVTVAANNLQAPASPFSLGSLEPSPSPANQRGSVSTETIIAKSSRNKNNTHIHLTELAELAADLARALSYTEGYGPGRGTQTQQETRDVYELQTLTRHPSIHAAEFDVVDSSWSPRLISRKVRAERRARRYVLV